MRRHVMHTAELLIAQEGGGTDVALDWTCPTP
jgi:hypothetical protein